MYEIDLAFISTVGSQVSLSIREVVCHRLPSATSEPSKLSEPSAKHCASIYLHGQFFDSLSMCDPQSLTHPSGTAESSTKSCPPDASAGVLLACHGLLHYPECSRTSAEARTEDLPYTYFGRARTAALENPPTAGAEIHARLSIQFMFATQTVTTRILARVRCGAITC